MIEAIVRGKERVFEAEHNGNLLTEARKHKLRVDSICRMGLCGACQVQVISEGPNLSEPTDQELLLLDEVPLSKGVRLACQARVLGPVRFRH